MAFRAGILLLTLLVGSYVLNLEWEYNPQPVGFTVAHLCPCTTTDLDAFPAVEEDVSVFFDHTNGRIVGGTVAGTVPHMVALVSGLQVRSLVCGGSLITQRHTLTAAHCIVPISSGNNVNSNARGIVGTNRWNSGGTPIVYARAIIHNNYRPLPILKNDIGILVSNTNVALSNAVRLVTLNWNWIGANVATTVSGWGRTSAGGSVSAVLMQVQSRTVDGNFCRQEVPRVAALHNFRNVPAVDPNIEICTFTSVGRGTCNGDSGSALLGSNGQQIGCVSWGIPCALGSPDMFVRVSAYRSWIESNIR